MVKQHLKPSKMEKQNLINPKTDISIRILIFIIVLIALYMIDYYISLKYFCSYCDYDDNSLFYKLFFYNDSETGYHSYPTLFNLIIIVILSFFASYLFIKQKKIPDESDT
jgi:H+/Cl- antiporter ClcA